MARTQSNPQRRSKNSSCFPQKWTKADPNGAAARDIVGRMKREIMSAEISVAVSSAILTPASGNQTPCGVPCPWIIDWGFSPSEDFSSFEAVR